MTYLTNESWVWRGREILGQHYLLEQVHREDHEVLATVARPVDYVTVSLLVDGSEEVRDEGGHLTAGCRRSATFLMTSILDPLVQIFLRTMWATLTLSLKGWMMPTYWGRPLCVNLLIIKRWALPRFGFIFWINHDFLWALLSLPIFVDCRALPLITQSLYQRNYAYLSSLSLS